MPIPTTSASVCAGARALPSDVRSGDDPPEACVPAADAEKSSDRVRARLVVRMRMCAGNCGSAVV